MEGTLETFQPTSPKIEVWRGLCDLSEVTQLKMNEAGLWDSVQALGSWKENCSHSASAVAAQSNNHKKIATVQIHNFLEPIRVLRAMGQFQMVLLR